MQATTANEPTYHALPRLSHRQAADCQAWSATCSPARWPTEPSLRPRAQGRASEYAIRPNVAIATAIRATTTALAMIVLSSTSITMVLPYRTPVYGLEKIACQIEASAGCKASRTWDQIVVVAAASTDRSVTWFPVSAQQRSQRHKRDPANRRGAPPPVGNAVQNTACG